MGESRAGACVARTTSSMQWRACFCEGIKHFFLLLSCLLLALHSTAAVKKSGAYHERPLVLAARPPRPMVAHLEEEDRNVRLPRFPAVHATW